MSEVTGGVETVAPQSTSNVIELTAGWVLPAPYTVMAGGVEIGIEHLAEGIAFTAPVGWRVHIPSHSGVRYVQIPEGWSAVVPLATACVVLENGRHFVNVTCREPTLAPGELEIASDGGRCRLNWQFRGIDPPAFRCLVFDRWDDLIADQRDWMMQAAGTKPLAEVAPEWLTNCPLLIYLDLETIDGKGLHHDFADVVKLAGRLAEYGAPADSMVYLTTWSDGGEKRWPTYEPSRAAGGLDGLRAAADALHERGFRMMLHANVWGCSPTHPEYTSLNNAVVHNRAGHPLGYREFHRSHVTDYFYVRPDFRAYVDLFWGSLRPIVTELGVDLLYLDQAGLLVDDPMYDILESTRRLIAIMREDAPNLALGGQVLSSRLCDEIVLWQLWGTPWSGHGWGQPFRRRSPLLADLFRDFTRFCAHLHLPAAVPGRFLWTNEGFADDLGMVGCFLAAQEDNTYHGAIPCVRLNFREYDLDPLSFEVIDQAARAARGA